MKALGVQKCPGFYHWGCSLILNQTSQVSDSCFSKCKCALLRGSPQFLGGGSGIWAIISSPRGSQAPRSLRSTSLNVARKARRGRVKVWGREHLGDLEFSLGLNGIILHQHCHKSRRYGVKVFLISPCKSAWMFCASPSLQGGQLWVITSSSYLLFVS